MKIFRVDNPHTKPFRFWEWLIAEVWNDPDVDLPRRGVHPAQGDAAPGQAAASRSRTATSPGATPSRRLTEYFTELTQTEVANTCGRTCSPTRPTSCRSTSQYGGPAAFQIRLVLAATLGASYGIYGPPFETLRIRPCTARRGISRLGEVSGTALGLGKPTSFATSSPGSTHPPREPGAALRSTLRFLSHRQRAVCSSTARPRRTCRMILVVVNLDPHHTQSGWVRVPLHELDLEPDEILPGPRPDHRRPLSLAWRTTSSARSAFVPPHILRLRRRSRRNGISIISYRGSPHPVYVSRLAQGNVNRARRIQAEGRMYVGKPQVEAALAPLPASATLVRRQGSRSQGCTHR